MNFLNCRISFKPDSISNNDKATYYKPYINPKLKLETRFLPTVREEDSRRIERV